MRIVIFCLLSFLVCGCRTISGDVSGRQDCLIDGVIQNIGTQRFWNVWVECEGRKIIGAGILPSGVHKTSHDIPRPSSTKMQVVIVPYKTKDQCLTYSVDLGGELFGKLTSGCHILYFQLNLNKKEVLFKCFDDEFPHDVLRSGERLTGATTATLYKEN